MTRSDLEKYHDIVVRLKILKTTVVTDSVKGSSADYPYVSHSITLHGVCCDDATISEVNRLEQKKAALDAYIDSIADERVRTLLDMKYRKGWNWAKISVGTGRSDLSERKYLSRFFKENLRMSHMSQKSR